MTQRTRIAAALLLALAGAGMALPASARHTHHKHVAPKHHAVHKVSHEPASETQVKELFEVMHLSRMFDSMNSQMAGVMGQAVPCVPPSYWQGFIDADATRQLLGELVPVYQKHFTAEDVTGLLKFYRSPLGQKVITQMPLTMAEGMKVGQQWGRQRGQQMIQALERKGTLDAQGQCPAAPAAAGSAGLPAPAMSVPGPKG